MTRDYAAAETCETCGRQVFACMLEGEDEPPIECPACRGESIEATVQRIDDAIADRKVQCMCPGCIATIPRWWASGLCFPCGNEDCEHDEPEEPAAPPPKETTP